MSFETLDREDVEGIHTIDLREKNPKDALKIPSPLMLGTKWTRDNGKTQISYELIAIEDVTIDGKTYQSCYKIKAEAKDGSHSELAWMAVGLGTIKSDSVWSNGRKLSVTLRDFKIGAP